MLDSYLGLKCCSLNEIHHYVCNTVVNAMCKRNFWVLFFNHTYNLSSVLRGSCMFFIANFFFPPGRETDAISFLKVCVWYSSAGSLSLLFFVSLNSCYLLFFALYGIIKPILKKKKKKKWYCKAFENWVSRCFIDVLFMFEMQGTRLGSSDPKGCFSKYRYIIWFL